MIKVDQIRLSNARAKRTHSPGDCRDQRDAGRPSLEDIRSAGGGHGSVL